MLDGVCDVSGFNDLFVHIGFSTASLSQLPFDIVEIERVKNFLRRVVAIEVERRPSLERAVRSDRPQRTALALAVADRERVVIPAQKTEFVHRLTDRDHEITWQKNAPTVKARQGKLTT